MSKSIGIIIVLIVIGAGVYYFGFFETETTIKITASDRFLLIVHYISSEGIEKDVFLNGNGDREWNIKGQVTGASLMTYGSNYCKMEIYRGTRLLWSDESSRGELLLYNRDVS